MNTSERNTSSGSPDSLEKMPDPDATERESSPYSSSTPPAALTEAQKAERVAELIAGQESGDAPARRAGDIPDSEDGTDPGAAESGPEGEGADGPGAEPGRAPGSVKELAELLRETPETLYGLSVTTGDGETVTLGELKDAWQDRRGAERELEERAAQLDQRETAQLADQQLWGQLAAELQDHLSDDMRGKVAERLEAQSETFRRGLLQAMPELADPVRKEAFESEIVEALRPYGISPREIGAFLTDHRAVVFLRDAMRTKARLEKLLSYQPDQAPPKGGRTNGRDGGKADRRKAQQIARAATGSEADKVDAVTRLIGGS